MNCANDGTTIQLADKNTSIGVFALAKQEALLSASGHEYDKDLARVPIKVSPALQALVANQLDIMDKLGNFCPEDAIYLEQLKLELVQVEEEISQAFARYMQRKEDQRLKRELKRVQAEAAESAAPLEYTPPPQDDSFSGASPRSGSTDYEAPPFDLDDVPSSPRGYSQQESAGFMGGGSIDQEVTLDKMASQMSPGLPSQKYEARRPAPEAQPEIDVKRVAIGASIKALEAFLGRTLTEEEMAALEQQVESYLG